jgi:hypothetical protein
LLDPAMTRLQSELHRLYLPTVHGADDQEAQEPRLIDANGQVRAMVLALNGPADWDTLSTVWHGVQAELELPAPAIAVAGMDGYQLWFSLAEPVPALQALGFLDALRQHYLGDIKPQRIGMNPRVNAALPQTAVHARLVPAELPDSHHWSAFVAPDLAPVFGAEPWLDSAPNPVGQSDLLSRLASMSAADFQRVLQRLRPSPVLVDATSASAPAANNGAAPEQRPDLPAPAGAWQDPKRFLLDVMNNNSVPLGLRIDAAKALLPYVDDPGRR